MTKNEVVNAVSALARPAGAFYGFETLTHPKMTKKSRATAEPWTKGEVTIQASFSAKLGVCYENCVNNAKERLGEARDFEAQRPRGKHYVDDSKWLMTDDATGEKFYVAIDKIGDAKKTILIDGRPATDEEVADLKENFFPKVSANSTAATYGVTWRTYGVDSIVAIR